MSGFRKAKAEQAALKIGVYGPTGSGKTLTTLLVLEGLAKLTGKRFAFVDTEHGTDFYTKAVAERTVHPDPFDFDALYTRSLTEVVNECRKLDPAVYCGVGIDSMTHLWEAAINAYKGGKTSVGTIPMHAWGAIKKPYKDLMAWAINTPLHVFLLGRQGVEYGDDEGGETKAVGYKMRAEGETAYEPHVLIRMEAVKPRPAKGKRPDSRALAVPTAFVEKDRSAILHGQLIEWPNFANIAQPLLHLLGDTQAQTPSEEETGAQDAEAMAAQERSRERESTDALSRFTAKLMLASSTDEVKTVGKEITPAVKKTMLPAHVSALRDAYLEAEQRVKNGSLQTNGQPQ